MLINQEDWSNRGSTVLILKGIEWETAKFCQQYCQIFYFCITPKEMRFTQNKKYFLIRIKRITQRHKATCVVLAISWFKVEKSCYFFEQRNFALHPLTFRKLSCCGYHWFSVRVVSSWVSVIVLNSIYSVAIFLVFVFHLWNKRENLTDVLKIKHCWNTIFSSNLFYGLEDPIATIPYIFSTA